MALYRDHAVVLRTWKLGEADRIVSLHTHDHGKVRGVAKGVRRTKSKFGARLEPLSHVTIQLYRGKGDLDTITQVETVDRFVSLRSDPDRFAARKHCSKRSTRLRKIANPIRNCTSCWSGACARSIRAIRRWSSLRFF